MEGKQLLLRIAEVFISQRYQEALMIHFLRYVCNPLMICDFTYAKPNRPSVIQITESPFEGGHRGM